MPLAHILFIGGGVGFTAFSVGFYFKYRSKIRFILATFGLRAAGMALKKKLSSKSISYCLRRDLTIPFEAPAAKIPVRVRKLQGKDIPVLFDLSSPGLAPTEKKEIFDRSLLLRERIDTCYVAVDQHDAPCYVQWLIGPNENRNLRRVFKKGFPWLNNDEALLEDAFTPQAFRGKGIMSSAMARIAERGKEMGARYVITFVHVDNIASLKGCKRSGFVPYKMREERNVFFRRSFTFTPLPEGAGYPFDEAPKSQRNPRRPIVLMEPDKSGLEASLNNTNDASQVH